MLVAEAASAESSQLLQRTTTDPRQRCTLWIKGGQKNTDGKQLIHFPIICASYSAASQVTQPHLDWFLGAAVTCSAHGRCTSAAHRHHTGWMRGSRMGGAQLPRIGAEIHWKLPKTKPGPLHVFLPRRFKMERKVRHQLGLLCYGTSELPPNNLMKQNDSDLLPLRCSHSFHPKIRRASRADLFRWSRGHSHPRMLCLQ